MTTINSTTIPTLNETITTLQSIREQYPRSVGTMVMVSPETEDQIEALLGAMNDQLIILEGADELTLASFDPDLATPEFKEWLEHARAIHDYELSEVHRAREFLARYYSH